MREYSNEPRIKLTWSGVSDRIVPPEPQVHTDPPPPPLQILDYSRTLLGAVADRDFSTTKINKINMGNKNLFFTLWILLGKFGAIFSSEPETATGAEFGEFADWGARARFSSELNRNSQKQVYENLLVRVGLITVVACESAPR